MSPLTRDEVLTLTDVTCPERFFGQRDVEARVAESESKIRRASSAGTRPQNADVT